MLKFLETNPLWSSNFMQIINPLSEFITPKEVISAFEDSFKLDNDWYILNIPITSGVKEDNIDVAIDDISRTFVVSTSGVHLGVKFSTANTFMVPEDADIDTFEAIFNENKLNIMVKKK